MAAAGGITCVQLPDPTSAGWTARCGEEGEGELYDGAQKRRVFMESYIVYSPVTVSAGL